VLAALVFAVVGGDLVPAEQHMQDAVVERLGPVYEDTVFETDELIEVAKLAMVYRAAFLDWASKEGIQPYPKFWGEEPVYKEWAKRALEIVQAKAPAKKLIVSRETEKASEESPTPPPPRKRLRADAAKRNEVKRELQARIDAGTMRIDDLGRNKEALAAEFDVSASTAYNAAIELREELKQKKK
jgi:hypothetical protein